MLRRINHVLNILIGTSVGVFLGHSLYACRSYHARPDLYAMQSAPWYTSILVHGMLTLAVLVILTLLKLILRSIQKKNH